MGASPHIIGGGKYSLLFDFECLWQIEQELGPLQALMADPQKMAEINTIGIFIWAALLESMPGITHKEARKVISEIGMTETEKAIEAGFKAAFPEKFKKKKAPTGAKKPKA